MSQSSLHIMETLEVAHLEQLHLSRTHVASVTEGNYLYFMGSFKGYIR